MSNGILLQDSRDHTKFTLAKADHVTGAPSVVDNDHAYLHEGHAYSAFVVDQSTATTVSYALVTPSSTTDYPYVHFRPVIATTTAPNVKIRLYEDSSATSTQGTAMTLSNHNRNSTNSAGTTMRSGITTTPATTKKIAEYFIGGGTGQANIGDQTESAHEWVLQPGMTYQIDYVKAAAANVLGIHFFMYEESLG